MKNCYTDIRPNGTCRIRVIVKIDGETIRTSTTYKPDHNLTALQNQKVAERMGADLIERVKREFYEEKEKKNPTFRQYYEEVYKQRAQLRIADTTFEFNCSIVEKHFISVFGDIKLKDITKRMLQDFIRELVNKENDNLEDPVCILPQTVERYVSPFRAVVSMAVREGILEHDPFAGGMEYPKMYLPIVQCLEKQEYARLLSILTHKAQDSDKSVEMVDVIIALGMLGGLRRGEIVALKWGDVQNLTGDTIESCRIRIVASAYKLKGKPQVRGNPKSEKSKRTFQAQRLLAEVLLKWKQRCRNYCFGVDDDDYVLTNRVGGMVSIYSPSKWVKKFLEKLDISKVGLHSLRHTFAAVLVRNNKDIETIRAMMGHDDIRTTQIYLYSFRLQEENLMRDVDEYNDSLIKAWEDKHEHSDNA